MLFSAFFSQKRPLLALLSLKKGSLVALNGHFIGIKDPLFPSIRGTLLLTFNIFQRKQSEW